MNGHPEQSPIEVLLPAFDEAPYRLAPERESELRTLVRERNIQFKLDRETLAMRFEGVNLFDMIGPIYIGVRGLERLWVFAYAATHVYMRFQANGFTRPLLLPATPEGRVVDALLRWAVEGEAKDNPAPWPADLPKPQLNPVDDVHLVANELFWGAGGFAVLHEIGHVIRRHGGMDQPRDVLFREEFEADEWAYDWVMDRWRDYSPNPLVHKKRTTLLASLFALIAIGEIHDPERVKEGKHPNIIDRTLRFLIKHANESSGLPDGLAWAVSATTIHLHLTHMTNETLPSVESFRDYFNLIRNRVGLQEESETE